MAREIQETQAELIETTFPKLNRCLTGYDLAHLRDEQGRFNLNSVLCGAEGSLGYVVEAKLNVLPIPKYAVLVNVRYTSFMDALRDANALMAHKPLSIETVDSKVLMLAMKDIVWHSVAEYFPADPALKAKSKAKSDEDEDDDTDGEGPALVETSPRKPLLTGPKDKKERSKSSGGGTVPIVPRRRDD